MLQTLLSANGAKWSNRQTSNETQIVDDFGDTARETEAILNSSAILHCSQWGRLSFTGKDHQNFLQRMSTNDIDSLENGRGIESVFTEAKGRVIDLATLYHHAETTLCVVSPDSSEELSNWLSKYTFSEEMTITNIESQSEMIEVWGPKTKQVVCSAFNIDIEKSSPHQLMNSAKIPRDAWFCIRPFDSHNGVRLIVKKENACYIWEQLLASGAIPAGETSWNSARIELGIPAKPNELNKNHNPWEANLGSAISLEKGCYIGQEIIARLEAYDKIKKALRGILFKGKVTPKPGSKLKTEGKYAGTISSSSSSTRTGVIALAYISKDYLGKGTKIFTELENIEGEIVTLPFMHTDILRNGKRFSEEKKTNQSNVPQN